MKSAWHRGMEAGAKGFQRELTNLKVDANLNPRPTYPKGKKWKTHPQ